MMLEARRTPLIVAAFLVVMACIGCASTSDEEERQAQQSAQELVAATQAAGVAPGLTVDVAESLYGTDAAAVCDVFDGGLSTATRNVILGNPAHGRRKTITDNAIVYGGLVVETYCPDTLDDYNDVVDDLDPFEADASDS